ncbi:hypothetical protein EZS27_001738 [termite gut metagenome]|uniref:Uncharacterized protein n=1 Tax=termite gut metagenome TaxID=433724 RepID=A0A5J4SZH2_9ZZZZ
MGKNKRKVHTQKEEKQAEKVIKIVFVSLIILALVLVVSFSFFG